MCGGAGGAAAHLGAKRPAPHARGAGGFAAPAKYYNADVIGQPGRHAARRTSSRDLSKPAARPPPGGGGSRGGTGRRRPSSPAARSISPLCYAPIKGPPPTSLFFFPRCNGKRYLGGNIRDAEMRYSPTQRSSSIIPIRASTMPFHSSLFSILCDFPIRGQHIG